MIKAGCDMVALLSGNAADGARDGFGYVRTTSVPSDASPNVGSRLCFVKQA